MIQLRNYISIIVAAVTLAASSHLSAEPITVRAMTFNLRYASPVGENSWPARRTPVKNAILTTDPDIIGTQEGLFYQLKQIDEDLEAYDWLGLGREGGSNGEFMAVFYKRDRFDVVAYDHFWLSDTPDVIGSKSWGNGIPRMVSWILFRDIPTGTEFYFWNTHFDHQSQPAREQSAELLISRIRERKLARPVIVTGDFNQSETNIVHETLVAPAPPPVEGESGGMSQIQLIDAWEIAEKYESEQTGTWNGWEGPNDSTRRIDWVLCSPHWSCSSASVVTYSEGDQWPSDHFPVIATLNLKGE